MVKPAEKIKLDGQVPYTAPIERKSTSDFSNQPQASVSTITKASKTEIPYNPSKPTLDPPIWKTLKGIERLEKVSDDFSRHKERLIQNCADKIEGFYKEELLKAEEANIAAKNTTFWGVFEDMSHSIMSSVSFLYGFSALSSGATVVGGALIVSGVLSLSNIAFKHAKAWDFVADQLAPNNAEMKQTISTYLPIAIGITTAAIGGYGTYQAWQYASHLSGTNQALSIIETTGNIAVGLAALATGKAGSHYKWTQAEITELQRMSDLTKIDVENMLKEVKDFYSRQLEMDEWVESLITAINQAQHQPV